MLQAWIDRTTLDPARLIPAGRQSFTGPGFGIAWALVLQVAGWVIQGIGLGMSVADAIKGAGEQVPADQKLQREDVSAVADQLATRFPTTNKASWEALLMEGLAGKVQTEGAVCPPGYYRDPVTGACMELKKGFQMPTWGWVAAIGGGFFLLWQMGLFQSFRRGPV